MGTQHVLQHRDLEPNEEVVEGRTMQLSIESTGWVIAFFLSYFIYRQSATSMAALQVAKQVNSELNLVNKHAVVVGGTAGIGRGIATRLVQASCSVTIVGRESSHSKALMKELEQMAAEQRSEKPRLNFVPCDCFLLKNVQSCVNTLNEQRKDSGIDYLVMSQGMATLQGFTPSKEEHLDQKLTLHIWSRVNFALGLLPSLKKSKDPRVLTVLSAGVHAPFKGYKSDIELSQGSYSLKNAADAGGFYNDIFVDKLSEENKEITAMHISPGFVATNWGTEMPAPLRAIIRVLQGCCGRSKADCAEFMIRGLTNEKLKGGFYLLDQYGEPTQTTTSLHKEAKEFVWAALKGIVEAGKSLASKEN